MSEIQDLTYDSLKAAGLSDDEINAILGVKEDTDGGSTLPFPIIKVNYDSDFGEEGALAFNPQKDENKSLTGYEKVFDNPVKIRILRSLFQYSKFDSTTNKTVISSNIFSSLRDAKKAYDLKTKKSISELKEIDEDIKLYRIMLVEILDGKDVYTGVFYTHGAYLYNLNTFLRDFTNEGHLNTVFEIAHKRNKKGRVVYFTPELVNSEKYDFIKTIKQDGALISKFNKWGEAFKDDSTSSSNNIGSKVSPDDIDIDEDEIPF